jgi:tetratricopeptide (TPR) repeat protein
MAFMDHLYGKPDQAMRLLDNSATIAKEYKNDLIYAGSHFLKAYICLDIGQYEKALIHYDTFLNIALTEPTIDKDDDLNAYYFFKGLVQLKLSRLDSARNYAERIKSVSDDPGRDFNYNYLKREIQIASARESKDLDSVDPVIYQPLPVFVCPWILIYNLPFSRNSLAEAYHRFGMLDKAITEYERLITFDPASPNRYIANPRYHYYLGIIYQEKGMKEKAIEQYRKFLDLWQDADPVFTEPKDARKRLNALLVVSGQNG